MTRNRFLGIVLVLLLPFITGFGPAHLTDADDPTMVLYADQLPSFQEPPPPALTAASAVILDDTTGRILYSFHGDERRRPASTTKVMTALVALERGRLTDRMRVTEGMLASLGGTGSSIMGLQYGDNFTLEELLYGLLLPSGNDAALVIASYIGGSVDGFVELMNQKAAELGLEDTHFANPHGLDADEHYTTAHDLAIITREAMRYPLFRKIVATKIYHLVQPREIFLVNTNQLIDNDQFPGFDGVKTGYTEGALQCLVGTIERNGQRIITVVLGSSDRNLDTVQLADYAYDTFLPERLPPPTPLPYLGQNGEIYRLVYADAPSLLIHRWEAPYLRASFLFNRAVPTAARSPIGKVQFRIGDMPLIDYPLLAIPSGQ